MNITKIFSFESAHKLENYEGVCANLHGHTYVLHVTIKGDVDKNGFVIDFNDLKSIVKNNVISILDHAYLNDIITQPTAEHIVIWIWDKLKADLNLHELTLYETKHSYVTYDGK